MSARVAAGVLALLLFVVTVVGAQPPSPPGGISVGPAFFLTVTKSGTGTGTVTGPGINCGSDCLEAYSPNAAVTLTAAPLSGSTFTGWSGGGCSGTGSCSVSMTAAQSVVAAFSSTTPVASVTLSWTDTNTSPQETGTQVWFCQGSGCTPSIGFIAGTPLTNVTQFTHTPVPAGVLGYAVRAVADPPIQPSAFSNTRYTVATGPDTATCALATTIFCEDWETATTPGQNWPDEGSPGFHAITTTPANVYSGTKALQVNWPAQDQFGQGAGFMTRWFNANGSDTTPLTAYEHVFVRFYVKIENTMSCGFDPSIGATRNCPKFIAISGNLTNDAYSSFGRAGECPVGHGRDFWYAGVAEDTAGPRNLVEYDYDALMTCNDPNTFGALFSYVPTSVVPVDTWTCIETEVQNNTVGQSDGIHRLWLNGTLGLERTNVRWRNDANLHINSLQLSFSGSSKNASHIWYDNIVVSTVRVGCLP